MKMKKRLADKSKVTDPRLDRLPEFDCRSLNYPIRALVGDKIPRSYTWACDQVLDQGTEGACVGFSWAHELIARPKVILGITNEIARSFYQRAQQLDEWPGTNYDGTSVLAGAKTVMEQGFLEEYRWAFNLYDLILAVGYQGPAVLGINWYTGMMNTQPDGFIKVSGTVAGGHAILMRGVSIKGQYGLLHNSWGPSWGNNGTAKISFDDLQRLMIENGEAAIPVVRTFGPEA
jgi:hypothetical protein